MPTDHIDVPVVCGHSGSKPRDGARPILFNVPGSKRVEFGLQQSKIAWGQLFSAVKSKARSKLPLQPLLPKVASALAKRREL